MANLPVTPHWAEIQRLAELGVPLPTLAERFNVNPKTVYNRCSSDDWLIPKRLKAKIEQVRGKTGFDPLFGGKSNAENSHSLLVETWQEKAEYVRTLAFETAIEAMEDSKGKLVAEKPSEFKALVHVARQATGLLDTDAPQIQLSMFANSDICGPSVMESTPIECETVSNGEDDADFWG